MKKSQSGKRKKPTKKVVISNNEVENVGGTKVASEMDQSLNESETGAGDGDSSFALGESQETPRGGAGQDIDSGSNKNADNDSILFGKSVVSELDEEEKKSESAKGGDASNVAAGAATTTNFSSPDKFERILDVLKSEEKDLASAQDAQQ